MNRSIDVVIACFNEESTIKQVAFDHHRVLKNSNKFIDFQITILDDGSSDNSRQEIEELAKQLPQVKIISGQKPSGIHGAFNKLIEQTDNDWVYFTPGDGQFPADILESILFDFNFDHDLYIANRTNQRDIYSVVRLSMSTLYRLLVLLITGVNTVDAGSTKLVKRDLLNFEFLCQYIAKDAEVIVHASKYGKKIKIVNTTFVPRVSGRSTINLLAVIKSFRDTLRLFPYRFIDQV